MLSAFSHFLCLKLKLFRKFVICIFTVVILNIVRNSKSFIPQFQSRSSNSHSFFTIFLGGLIRIFLFRDHFLPLRHFLFPGFSQYLLFSFQSHFRIFLILYFLILQNCNISRNLNLCFCIITMYRVRITFFEQRVVKKIAGVI